MTREELLKIVLGDRYEEGKEIGETILDYLAKNPHWEEDDLGKDQALQAMDNAVTKVYGHNLEYYATKSRKRESVEVRQMVMYLFYTQTRYSLQEIGRMFNRHHSTVIFAKKEVEGLLAYDKAFAKDFKRLEKTYKKFL